MCNDFKRFLSNGKSADFLGLSDVHVQGFPLRFIQYKISNQTDLEVNESNELLLRTMELVRIAEEAMKILHIQLAERLELGPLVEQFRELKDRYNEECKKRNPEFSIEQQYI